MATNDALLIDGVIDDLLEASGSRDRGKTFEFFSLSQVLKEWDLDVDELDSGWTDGRQDGGIDGFYVLINGHCIRDIEGFLWPKGSAEIVVHIVTCKHADKFLQAPLDALVASLTELLNFSIDDQDLKGAYSAALLKCRARLLVSYRKLAPRLTNFKVICSYVSRGSVEAGIGIEVRSRAEQIVGIAKDCFNDAEVEFDFVGSSELIGLHRRRPNFSLDLPYVSSLNSAGSNYVLLVGLRDYFGFSSDEQGKLRRYLFESNVRDFMGVNRVNEDIAQSLADQGAPDFWWLNNGVTILATKAWSTGNVLHMENVQIVNGLQTTESIYRHFSGRGRGSISSSSLTDGADGRSVMVKVICSSDEEARDRIIRATNNQTSVEQISLHATEKIQRDIEESLYRVGIHYERRKNYYVNQGVPIHSVVTPMHLAAGMVALGRIREPWSAVALKQRNLSAGGLYADIFSERTDLGLWASIVLILRAVDSVLEEARSRSAPEGFKKKNRYLLALLAVARRFGTFNYAENDLSTLDVDENFLELVRETLNAVPASVESLGRKRVPVIAACKAASEIFGLDGFERIRRGGHAVRRQESLALKRNAQSGELSAALVEKIRAALPPQPWKPGAHMEVCRQVKCTRSQCHRAVSQLIEEGVLLRQVEGVLYNPDGTVHSYDMERVMVSDSGAYVFIDPDERIRRGQV